jgi:serine protease Do
MTLLEETQSAIQDAATRLGPAVVGLGRGWGVGSGVVIGPSRVLTNAHNLRHRRRSR